jgi:hypothetical protein
MLNLPETGPDSKAILLFSGGVASKYLADQLAEKNSGLENVIALYFPATNIFRYHYAKNNIIKQNLETEMQGEYDLFVQATNALAFGEIITIKTYEDCTFANGDNLIGDSGRLSFYKSLIQLLQEKGYPLADAASAVAGMNKRIFEHQYLLNNITHNFGVHIKANREQFKAILEDDPELINYGNDHFVIGTYPPFQLFDVEDLDKNDKLYFPFKDMTKSEIRTLIGTAA